MKPLRPTIAEIHIDCLDHNINLIRNNFPKDTFICPMVKANAYGHGDVLVASRLQHLGIKQVGVCLTEEAVHLREAGIKTDILVFRGGGIDELSYFDEFNLTPVVGDWCQLENLQKNSKRQRDLHIKFNSGMNRLGFETFEAEKIAELLRSSPHLKLKGVLTHLPEGENSLDENSATEFQLKKFSQVIPFFKQWSPIFHALSSGGIICKIFAEQNTVSKKYNHWWLQPQWGLRPGLSLYGYNATPNQLATEFKPVMTLRSQLQSIRKIEKGTRVSYGGTWEANKDSVIGVVPLGYADGIPRAASGQLSFLIKGQRVQQIGRVCMDFLMVDLTDLFKQKILCENELADITLFGWQQEKLLSAQEMADKANTITWEIVTRIGDRVPRVKTNLADQQRVINR